MSLCLRDKLWRLSNLYQIVNNEGKQVEFVPNIAQKALLNREWWRNLIIKARKEGMTTLIDIMGLDRALWAPHQDVQIISDTMPGAKRIFRNIVKHAYDGLPEKVRRICQVESCTQTELVFRSGSSVSVGVTARSSTPTYLHVSEYGRISAKWPDKAREILTGSIQAVASTGDQRIFIESTAMGRNGEFWNMFEQAQKKQGRKLTKLDYAVHFFGWWMLPDYALHDSTEPIPDKCQEHFDKVSARFGVILSKEQKQWYVSQYGLLGPDIKSEFPGLPEEPFEVAQEGNYFGREMAQAYQQGRVKAVPHDPLLPVHTWWDIGVNDPSAIWFVQIPDEQRVNIIDYYEKSNEGLEFFRRILEKKGYRYGTHNAPHDIAVKEWGGSKTRLEIGLELGIRFKLIPRVQHKMDSIEAARRFLKRCWFDEEKCAEGLEHLEGYRRSWDEKHGMWNTTPVKSDANHAADSFQGIAMSIDGVPAGGFTTRSDAPTVQKQMLSGWTAGRW